MTKLNPIDDVDLYGTQYFQSHYVSDPKRDEMQKQEYNRFMTMKPPFPDGFEATVLDVGCGVGNFLSIFKEQGWKCYGVEPSSYARQQAARKGIFAYESLRYFSRESVDVVIFRGTLQHINYPMEALVQATRILKTGGTLVILATPNTEGWVYQIWKTLPALEPARNWVLFGNSELTNILKRLNYSHIQSVFPYWDTPYANPIMDFLKFAISLLFGYRKFAFPKSMMEIYAIKGNSDE